MHENFRLILSEKFRMTVLVVPHDEQTSRLYNFSKATQKEAVRYYHCSKCRQLNRQSAVIIRVKGGQLEEENTTHHPLCVPLPNELIRATQIHRTCKLLVKEGHASPLKAFEKAAVLAATEGPSILAHLGTWKQVSSSYYYIASQAEENRKRKNGSLSGAAAKRASLGSVDD